MSPSLDVQKIAAKVRSAGVKLGSPLSEIEATAFERAHGVSLPSEYREFLLHVGDGGSGPPELGICRLGLLPSGYDLPAPILSKLFPFTRSWVWEGGDTSAEGTADDVRSGVVILGTDGCAQYWALVVTGPERGKIWMLTDVGIQPLNPSMTFLEWYDAWLGGKREWWS